MVMMGLLIRNGVALRGCPTLTLPSGPAPEQLPIARNQRASLDGAAGPESPKSGRLNPLRADRRVRLQSIPGGSASIRRTPFGGGWLCSMIKPARHERAGGRKDGIKHAPPAAPNVV